MTRRRNRRASWTPLPRVAVGGERTGGRGLWTGTHLDWRAGRGRRTAAAAADLHGVAGRGPQAGPQPAEVDAPVARNTLLSVRRVTEINAGRKTAGVDGQVVASAAGARPSWSTGSSSRRSRGSPGRSSGCIIPKANGKQRPLGIPVIADRALQARVVNALEPEWEARFEPKSYGFRPGRGCHDAIVAIYHRRQAARRPSGCGCSTPTWQRRSTGSTTTHLLSQLGTFPARGTGPRSG